MAASVLESPLATCPPAPARFGARTPALARASRRWRRSGARRSAVSAASGAGCRVRAGSASRRRKRRRNPVRSPPVSRSFRAGTSGISRARRPPRVPPSPPLGREAETSARRIGNREWTSPRPPEPRRPASRPADAALWRASACRRECPLGGRGTCLAFVRNRAGSASRRGPSAERGRSDIRASPSPPPPARRCRTCSAGSSGSAGSCRAAAACARSSGKSAAAAGGGTSAPPRSRRKSRCNRSCGSACSSPSRAGSGTESPAARRRESPPAPTIVGARRCARSPRAARGACLSLPRSAAVESWSRRPRRARGAPARR